MKSGAPCLAQVPGLGGGNPAIPPVAQPGRLHGGVRALSRPSRRAPASNAFTARDSGTCPDHASVVERGSRTRMAAGKPVPATETARQRAAGGGASGGGATASARFWANFAAPGRAAGLSAGPLAAVWDGEADRATAAGRASAPPGIHSRTARPKQLTDIIHNFAFGRINLRGGMSAGFPNGRVWEKAAIRAIDSKGDPHQGVHFCRECRLTRRFCGPPAGRTTPFCAFLTPAFG